MSDDDNIGTVRWFGPTWGAPVNSPHAQIPQPVNTKCINCGLFIESDEQGIRTVTSLSIDGSGFAYFHLQCFLQEIGAV